MPHQEAVIELSREPAEAPARSLRRPTSNCMLASTIHADSDRPSTVRQVT